ncbi:BTAD domain-containing putative transcriptional regulator [Actinoplanes sichuanensis]|uniref:BTAD domain-containing putative transcriptional regulator n=1 Tax=Actinoplanes sichuanensis TaxID=512349 RepID=A0ABW4A4R6_9ACTN|nr:BTAD domain-containing putative transcriptional regulator [Actinoplanes sichuanensis]BEL05845.1 BTAD domain-containing putative transcriptional regulator [Actinoplanes sichuanensis]
MPSRALQLKVLGPVVAEYRGQAVDLGGPLQRAVLAMLLAARGTVVSADRLIEQLWHGRPPPRATTSLQTYVSNLRRLLEPDRRPRTPSTTLLTVPPGYAISVSDDDVDAWRFERLVRAARKEPPETATVLLEEALRLWRGPAYAEFADADWAQAEVGRLDELHLLAREAQLDATVRSGQGAVAVPLAEAMTREYPLREEAWRQLALALWATGRRAEALEALGAHRRVLRDELGLNPTRRLADLEVAILSERDDLRPGEPSKAVVPFAGEAEPFVGRTGELRRFHEATGAALRGGGIVLISGESGIGKSRLLGRALQDLAATGWTVLSGCCPEYEGAPPAWAWTEVLRSLEKVMPPPEPAVMAPLLGDVGAGSVPGPDIGRFPLHQAVVRWLGVAAAAGPLVVAVDDLQNADGETLTLFERAVEGLAGRPALVVGTYRPGETGSRVADTLARVARRVPVRINLPGLTSAEVGDLIAAVTGVPADDRTVEALTDRTGGNPFYVGECARLLAAEGPQSALTEVPDGVREVLRRRLARLGDRHLDVLRVAALLGGDADPDVLAEVAGVDPAPALETAFALGLLVEGTSGHPAFRHSLLRDLIYGEMPTPRRARLHAAIAAVLERERPDDHVALARHYSRALTAATAGPAMRHSMLAAAAAERVYAFDVAAELLTQAVEAAGRMPRTGDHDARIVQVLSLLVRAQIKAGAMSAARASRRRAMDHAEHAGRDDLLAEALAAWSEPTSWQSRAYGTVDLRTVTALNRLLSRGALDPRTRCRLLDTLVSELDGDLDPRAVSAAQEQLALARDIGEPELIAAGLMAVAKCTSYEHGAERRGRIADELRDLARGMGLPVYHWLAEHIAGTVRAAAADPDGLRRHAELGIAIAGQHGLAEQEAVNRATLAMLAHIRGDFAEARELYDDVYERMLAVGAIHAWTFHSTVQITLYLSEGRYAEAEPLTRAVQDATGNLENDRLALVLARQGRLDEARAVPRDLVLRDDYLQSYFGCLKGDLAVLLGERENAPMLIDRLLPLRDLLGGVTSTSMVSGPVAITLGGLYRLIGDDDRAAEEFRHAVVIARRWGSPHWEAAAQEALARLPG